MKGSAFRNQQDGHSGDCVDRSVAEEDRYTFSKGKRYETLRVSDYMSCADGGTGDHLRPKAPCAGPLAVWHKLTARPGIKNRQRIPRPRAVSVRVVETCAGQVLRPYGGDSGAHYRGAAAGLCRQNLFELYFSESPCLKGIGNPKNRSRSDSPNGSFFRYGRVLSFFQ